MSEETKRLERIETNRRNMEILQGEHLPLKFERADNYDTMLREINERGERIKRLGEELKLAHAEGYADCVFTGGSEQYGMAWETSRAKRVAEGVE